MSQQFYIAVNGQQTGPFTIDDLKAKNIQRDTLVWTDGFDNWTKAEHVALLKDILRASPPPLPKIESKATSEQIPLPPTPTPPITSGNYFGYELAGKRERFFAVLAQTIIFLLPWALISDGIDPYSIEYIVASVIFSAILGVIFYPMWGGNLGHKIMGLQVISSENGEVQNNAKAGLSREALKSLFGTVIVPVIWLLWDDNRQNLYDKVVKTYVVKKK